MKIVLMFCFARSGGTILNKCLGSLDDVIMISEVNPLGGGGGVEAQESLYLQTIKTQAKVWYNIDLKSDENDFTASALELAQICRKMGKTFIIRDWTYINFMPEKSNSFNPSKTLLAYEKLNNKCTLIPFAFVRDAIDIWLSIKSKKMDNFSLDEFSLNYLVYINSIIKNNIKFFKFEDFTTNPKAVIQGICDYIGIRNSFSFANYNMFDKLNGDIKFGKESRGIRQNTIKPLLRKATNRENITAIDSCEPLQEANHLLEYPIHYHDQNIENISSTLFDYVQSYLQKLSKVTSNLWK